MKTLIFTIIALGAMQTAKAQIAPSSCYTSSGFFNAYRSDVAFLAAKRLFEVHHPDTMYVNIPQIHMDSIWTGLSSIFNLVNQFETDSVFARHCIHKFPYYENSVVVLIDTSFAWTNAWLNQINVTGYGALDSFMTKYDLHIGNVSCANYADLYTLSPLFPFNMDAMADSIKQFAGINFAAANHIGADGDDIVYVRDADSAKFTFWLKWGDCMAGCINGKSWNYAVTQNCEVIYLDTTLHVWGNWEPYPVPVNCNLVPNLIAESKVAKSIEIYPNPVTDKLFIKTPDMYKNQKYKIVDFRGVVLLQNDKFNADFIDVVALKPGIYILLLEDNEREGFKNLFVKR